MNLIGHKEEGKFYKIFMDRNIILLFLSHLINYYLIQYRYTGYDNTSGILFDSIYSRMVKRNRCNHRDYQNICVNGIQFY